MCNEIYSVICGNVVHTIDDKERTYSFISSRVCILVTINELFSSDMVWIVMSFVFDKMILLIRCEFCLRSDSVGGVFGLQFRCVMKKECALM